MYDASSEPFQPRQKPPPFINAPPLVIGVTLLLIVLHGGMQLLSPQAQGGVLYDYALAPQRFWAAAGSIDVYPNAFAGLVTLLSTALLHADWTHVLVNAFMLLALGAPVARVLGSDAAGMAKWLVLFLGSVIGGSALYLALAGVGSPYAIGASGGVSGIFAAAFLLGPGGTKQSLLSPSFLRVTVAFAIANAVLVFAAPYLLGMMISWEAHAGGYITGALLMAVLPVRGGAFPGTRRART